MIANQFTFHGKSAIGEFADVSSIDNRLPHATLFDIIKPLGIDMHKPAHLLSGGQRQFLAILMALQKPTKLLFLDEPTATLDKKNAHLSDAMSFSVRSGTQGNHVDHMP